MGQRSFQFKHYCTAGVGLFVIVGLYHLSPVRVAQASLLHQYGSGYDTTHTQLRTWLLLFHMSHLSCAAYITAAALVGSGQKRVTFHAVGSSRSHQIAITQLTCHQTSCLVRLVIGHQATSH